MQHDSSPRTTILGKFRWIGLLLVMSVGIVLGYSSRPVDAERPAMGSGVPEPVGAESVMPSTDQPSIPSARPGVASVSTAPAGPTPMADGAAWAPLPGAGPLAPLLPELRERARRGDMAAARRAHRDLFFCEHAAYARGSDPHARRVRCVAEQVCGGLQDADFSEGGRFLLRAAELGDIEAMAAVADGFALGMHFSGPNLAASRALGPQYLRQALEAAVPLALGNAYTACRPPEPFGLQTFRRSLSHEEQYAWGVAVLTIPGSRPAAPTLAAMRDSCARHLDPRALQRAEAHGLRLHAQHLSHLRDRDTLGLGSTANLGIARLDDANDPRLLDWPQCATGF